MLKICGAALTFFACTAIGVWLQSRLVRRVHLLDSISGALAMLRTEIVFLQTPLPRAVRKIATATQDALFLALCPHLDSANSPVAAMEAVVLPLSGVLSEADCAALVRLSMQLGASDAQTQAQHIDIATQQLRAQLAQAREAASMNGRLYLASGVLVGVLLVILML